MNKDCEGCGKEDCEPFYNDYADLMLCDYCYGSAEDERDDFLEDEDFSNNWSDGEVF
ncbi:hypothetical protein D3C87_324690 [compost metagenome]